MINLDTIPSIISLLIIISVYKKLQPQWLRLFLYFLFFSVVIDLTATFYSQYFKKSNHFIINLTLPVIFTFYFYIFYKAFETKKLRKMVYASFIIYMIFFFCDIIFINGLFFYNSYSYCLGCILIILCCLLYFMWLFTSEMLVNYFKIPMFWIATGLMFFYAGNIVLSSLMGSIIDHSLDFIFYPISIILSIILYGALSIGFLCNKPWKKIR